MGVGVIGFFGGWLLQKFTAITLGIAGGIFSSSIVLCLALMPNFSIEIGLIAAFTIFLINGIDHPNNLRFFNEAIEQDKKLAFFSLKESATYCFALITPVIAAVIINKCGTKICFFIDFCTYIISFLPWFFLRKKYGKTLKTFPDQKSNWFIGFKLLISNEHIKYLNISRLMNNLSFVTWTTALPLLLAQSSQGQTDIFVKEQGLAISLVSAGFIMSSLIGTCFSKHAKMLIFLSWSASIFGFFSVILLVVSTSYIYALYFGAFLSGMGTYCFRISGMTLGQAITPKNDLGAVIIAGDTVVRIWSFFVSCFVIFILGVSEKSHNFQTFFIIFIPIFSLLSPLLLKGPLSFYSNNKLSTNES